MLDDQEDNGKIVTEMEKANKAYRELDYDDHDAHNNFWERIGIAPRIFNLGTR
jgi:hypothetical protein